MSFADWLEDVTSQNVILTVRLKCWQITDI